MDPTNILIRLEKRLLGYGGFRKNIFDLYIEKLDCAPDSLKLCDIGNTFACRFSRNQNNLHILACSTEHGEIVVQNTIKHSDFPYSQFKKNLVHDNAIFNFAWAEPKMKLITACGDQTSKLCNLDPSGHLVTEKEFFYNSSVKSVMFCPGSTDVFCGGCQDGFIKIWDARRNSNSSVLNFDHQIPNAHTVPCFIRKKKKSRKAVGVSCVIFKNDHTVLSCSSMDPYIKVWDTRKSYRQVTGIIEPVPLLKYSHENIYGLLNSGYVDMVTNPLLTHLYASGIDNVIYCYPLDSTTNTDLICKYSGHEDETCYSKISINFPYIEKPVYAIMDDPTDSKAEFSNSDWCADNACLKFAASADSMPLIWSTSNSQCNNKSLSMRFTKTSAHKSKLLSSNNRTVPIKLLESIKLQTEEDMKDWDTWNPLPSVKVLEKTPKKMNPVAKKQTPTSGKKRKQSLASSPNNLIDQYFTKEMPHNKRSKLEAIFENDSSSV
ncbi:denticleless protein homolog B isoform X2 [Adelges cooleyi]|uniref:denticleless protein homolog B isoform X2 n=1 Tax=Adelges cooleyi TaxID=133065 RepID=UPI00217F340D|nr:denticleless protein homolog B isoform X2 [Adelges cooleyi]